MRAINKIQVAIADDHTLLRKALARLINTFEEYNILFEAENGKDLRNKVIQNLIPDIIVLDVNMPEVDGFEAAKWLQKSYPQVKVLVLSMLNDELSIIKMFRLGVKGYLLKNTEPEEFRLALDSIVNKNLYLTDYASAKLVSGLKNSIDLNAEQVIINEREREFLRWVCTDLSYKEIGEKMYVSARTADDYRQALFIKLKVHSRVGLVIYAIKNGIVEL